MVYCFHHFYYWLKGGVETGQAYRAALFRELGIDARFVYATPFPNHVFRDEIHDLGIPDSEAIWMYSAFTDCRISSVTYTLEQFLATLGDQAYTIEQREGSTVIRLQGTGTRIIAEFVKDSQTLVRRIQFLSGERLLRIDYYTYCRIYSEFYAPKDGHAELYLRRFYNENGSAAYEELVTGNDVIYKFPDRILYSREEFLGYFMSRLNLSAEDTVIIDGEPGNIELSAFIENAVPARVGLFLHSNHYIREDGNYILWYYIYEYAFAHPEKISFFVTNTQAQADALKMQLKKYRNVDASVYAIPTSGIDTLIVPTQPRRRHALMTAGRLAPEKNTGWIIRAVAEARAQIPDLTLDIYGEGSEYEQMCALIQSLNCGGYVRLCGFQKLTDVYQAYDAYISASFGETLGITFLEALGSGLPLVAFDRPYGAQCMIDDGKNGFKAQYGDIHGLAQCLVKLFQQDDLEAFRQHSYAKAREYLREEIEKKWKRIL